MAAAELNTVGLWFALLLAATGQAAPAPTGAGLHASPTAVIDVDSAERAAAEDTRVAAELG